MIHWNNLSPTERLELWRQEREDLSKKNYMDRLSSLSLFFSHVPYGARTLDYYTTESWLTPWEILHYGTFCRNSISLLMYHTLTIADPEINIELCLIDDKEDMYLVPIVDNKFVLGYIPGQVAQLKKLKKSFQIKQTFQKEQIKKFA
jgi:hypothetical protein